MVRSRYKKDRLVNIQISYFLLSSGKDNILTGYSCRI
jgi:hypothetical protein